MRTHFRNARARASAASPHLRVYTFGRKLTSGVRYFRLRRLGIPCISLFLVSIFFVLVCDVRVMLLPFPHCLTVCRPLELLKKIKIKVGLKRFIVLSLRASLVRLCFTARLFITPETVGHI